MKRFILTELERKKILKMYGLINEQEGSDPKNPDVYPDHDEIGFDDSWSWDEWKIYFESLKQKYGELFAKKRFLKYWEPIEQGVFVKADNDMNPEWFREKGMWNEEKNRPLTAKEFESTQIEVDLPPTGVSDKLVEFVKKEEFFVPCVYDDKKSVSCIRGEMKKCCLRGRKSIGIPTIGYGTTYYLNGKKVTSKDKDISEQKATEYLKLTLNKYASNVLKKYPNLNQHQLDAMTSLCYNVGFSGCTKKAPKLSAEIIKNPNSKTNPNIKNNFMDFANTNRRQKEFMIYHDAKYDVA